MTDGKWTQEMKDDFDLKVFKVLSNMLPLEFDQEVPVEEAQGKQKLYLSQWLNSGAKSISFNSVADALVDFQRYISAQHIKYSQAKEEYVEFSVSIDYGQAGGIITWKLGSQFQVSTPNDRLNAQAALWQAIGQMRDDFERKTMLRVKNENVRETNAPNTMDVISCSRLIVDVKDGKVAYKLKGGKWEKFGVRVFADILEKIGINVETIPLVGIDMTGYEMTILMRGDKPDKVTKLVKVG
jgi:hypothetical protein